MDSTLRVVTTIPMNELWDDTGAIAARRDRDLWAEDIKSLLRVGPVEFVIAHVGQNLVWKSASECYSFWQDEVLPHLPTDEQALVLGEPEERRLRSGEEAADEQQHREQRQHRDVDGCPAGHDRMGTDPFSDAPASILRRTWIRKGVSPHCARLPQALLFCIRNR